MAEWKLVCMCPVNDSNMCLYFPCAIQGLYTVVRLCNIQVPPDGPPPDPDPDLAAAPAPRNPNPPDPAHPPHPDVIPPPLPETEPVSDGEVDEDFLEEQAQAVMNEHDEPLPKPHSYKQYEFSESFAQESVGPAKNVNQTFLHTTKDHLDAIEAKYNEMYRLRQRIDDFLKGFKQSLYVSETSDLPLCFKRLRERAGDFETLKLNTEELYIIVGETADEDVKEPVLKFNFMLKECREFPGSQHTAHEFINDKISAVEKEPVQTQTTQDALQRAKTQLKMLQTWGKEIENLVSATKSAAGDLLPNSKRIKTGLIRINRED